MLENVIIGQYLSGQSMLHGLDPRSKLVGVLLFMVSLFLVDDFWVFGVLGTFLLLLVLASRVPVRLLLRGLRSLMFFLLITVLLQVFLTPGETLVKVGPLTGTWDGLFKGSMVVTRIFLLIVSTSLLTLTTSPLNLTDGIEALLQPFRRFGVPAHELAMMMSIALRFIPTFAEEADKIIKAQKARGADFDTGKMINRIKSLIPLLVPLLVSAFRRADELALAMEARGYRGGENRTKMHPLKLLSSDYLALGIMGIILGCAIGIRLMEL